MSSVFAVSNVNDNMNDDETAVSSNIPEGETLECSRDTLINPLYPDYTPSGTEQPSKPKKAAKLTSAESTYYSNIEDAGSALRSEMVNRNGTIVIGYDATEELKGVSSTKIQATINNLQDEIREEAFRHTGNGKEGDTLRWHYAAITPSWNGNTATKLFNLTYIIEYYTNSNQEKELDGAIAEIEKSFGFDAGTSDYEKILDIYDFICGHVVYDEEHMEDTSYKLKYTPYAAVMNGTAVCQGYAQLFYRLVLDSGMDARLIPGTGNGGNHAWNIVQLDGKYYYLDSTWDSECFNYRESYAWFLRGKDNFPDHVAGQYSNGEETYKPEELSKLSSSDYPITMSIRRNPINAYAQPGEYALFVVSALGTNLTYSWEFRFPNTEEWYELKAYNDYFMIEMDADFDGIQFRCVVSDGNSIQYSEIATLYIGEYMFGVAKQPEHTAVKAGENAQFHVSAIGTDLTYQWQTLNNKNEWIDLTDRSATTDTLSVTAKQGDNRKRFRCIVKDGQGNTDVSVPAILAVIPEKPIATLRSHTISLAGNIGINYYLYLSDEALNDSGAKVVFSMPNNLTDTMSVDKGIKRTSGDATYYIYSCNVHSTQMTGTVTAKVVLSDGRESEEFPYTVKDYADIIIANKNNSAAFTKATPLVKAMLNYGGYAQEFFRYDDSPLANADLTASEKDVSGVKADDLAQYAVVKKGSTPTGLSYKSSTLVLTSATAIRHNFTLEDGHDISEYTFRCGSQVLTPVKRSDNLYYVEILNVASGDLDTMYTVTVGSFSVKYSALTYAYNQLRNSTNTALRSLLQAMVVYNRRANDYFGV